MENEEIEEIRVNSNKVSVILNRIFQVIMFLAFTYTTIASMISLQLPLTYVAVFLFIVAFTTIVFVLKKYEENLTNKRTWIILGIFMFVMAVVLVIVGYKLRCNPVTDLKVINQVAKNFAVNGSFAHAYNGLPKGNADYLARYPNNNCIAMLLAFYYRAVYLILGYIPLYAPVLLNTVAIFAAVIFTILIAKKIGGNLMAVITAILCLIFLPFYTYTPYFYTDSLTLPFVTGTIFIFICATKMEKRVQRYILMFVCGALLLVGFRLKGSVIIVLVAIFTYIILSMNLKRACCMILVLLVGFGSTFVGYNALLKSQNITTEKISYKEEFPLTHWVMLGLNKKMGYVDDDRKLTSRYDGKDAKMQANIKEIKKRLENFGAAGLAVHFSNKAVFAWNDGTYYIENHIYEPIESNVLHEFVLDDGVYHNQFLIYSNGFHFFMLLMIICSLIKGIKKPKIDYQTLIKGVIFGIFVFFLIWETRSRYIMNITPLLLIIAADGLLYFADAVSAGAKKLKKPKIEIP